MRAEFKPKEFSLRHFRSSLFLGVASATLACSTLILTGWVYLLHNQSREKEQVLRSASINSQAAFQKMELVFATAERRHWRSDIPHSAEGEQILSQTADFFQKFIKQNSGPYLRFQRARAYHLLGRYHNLNGDVGKAETAYLQANKILVELIEDNPHPEYLFILAGNNNYLCHLLAAIGKPGEALKAGLRAKEHMSALVNRHALDPPFRHALVREMAVAANNLGVLSLAGGKTSDALDYFRTSRFFVQQSIKEAPQDVSPMLRLVDFQQLNVSTLRQADRLPEALRCCADSLSVLRYLEDRQEDLAELQIDFAAPRALVLARQREFERALDAGKDWKRESAGAEWNWPRLHPRDGKTLQTDLLIKGRLPADFERQHVLLLAFNWNNSQWWSKSLIDIVKNVRAKSKKTRLMILAPDAEAESYVRGQLQRAQVDSTLVSFVRAPTDTVWVRDYGPLAIETNGAGAALVNARYRSDRNYDERIPARLARQLQMPEVRTPLRLAGGNLLSNGKGLCIATMKLLEQNAEMGFSEKFVTKTIKRLFGAKQVVYLEALHDEPTGHVDLMAAFLSPGVIVVGDCRGVDADNAAILDRNANRLARLQVSARPLRVVRIPQPPRGKDGFIATYTNVVFANGVLLVPTWTHAADKVQLQALATYRRLLPGWKVIGINADKLGWRRGALRCATLTLLTVHRSKNANLPH